MKIIGALTLGVLVAASVHGAQFRAAAVEVDITPGDSQWLVGYAPRRSTGVHDKIYHRILALDDGTTQFYLIASDLCLFSPGIYDQVVERLGKELGIQPQDVWWSVTHSHSTPEVGPPGVSTVFKTVSNRNNHDWNHDYTARVMDAAVEGVKAARAKLEPARIAIGTGMAMANINRRAIDVDGHISLGLNPYGPADRQIGLIRIERPDGSPIAVVMNYAMHGTVLGGENTLISGDAPGTVSAYVEQKVGAPVLYVNGAAGNLAPIYTVYKDFRSGHLSEFRVLLGDRVLQALGSLGPATADVSLAASATTVETPRQPGMGWPDDLGAYTRNGPGDAPLVRLPVRFLRINDTIIWSAPVELFCEIAIAVRNQSPFPHTFYFGYTGGWLGYFPTKQAFHEGGYEPGTSPFSDAGEEDLREGVVTYLQGLSHPPAQ